MKFEIYRVTTLNAGGPGSLSEGLRHYRDDVERFIVFDVTGTITLDMATSLHPGPNKDVLQGHRNITVFGNTSPGGIQITGFPQYFVNSKNVELRHLSWSLQTAGPKDAKWWNPVKGLAIDSPEHGNGLVDGLRFFNCSIRGGQDENDFGPEHFPSWDWTRPALRDVVFADCIFAFCFTIARENERHNFSLMLNAAEHCMVRNCLFAHSNRRSPQVQGSAVVSGNVIYNYGTSGIALMPQGSYTVRDNHFIPGPHSRQVNPEPPISIEPTGWTQGDTHIFLDGNSREELNQIPAATDWDLFRDESEGAANVIEADIPPIRDPYTMETDGLVERILAMAGSCYRDSWDTRAVTDVATRSGGWARTEHAIGGIPSYQSCHSPLILPHWSVSDVEDMRQFLTEYRFIRPEQAVPEEPLSEIH